MSPERRRRRNAQPCVCECFLDEGREDEVEAELSC